MARASLLDPVAGGYYIAAMLNFPIIHLDGRGLIRISGDDVRSYLQGLISNDVNRVTPERALYAAFLTPQGKFLHEFFVFEMDGALYLDCEKDRLADLLKRLRLYKLRSKITLEDAGDAWAVYAAPPALATDEPADAFGLPGTTPGAALRLEGGGVAYVDPRQAQLGVRCALPGERAEAILAALGGRAGSIADYERLRVALGVPDGSRDMPVDKAVLLEYGFDEMNGVDWDKGCYMGQELTARTRYRGLVRKRLLPVRVEGPLPAPATAITMGEKAVGDVRSGIDGWALAYLRMEAVGGDTPLRAGDAVLHPVVPDWMRLPEQADAE